MKRNLNFTYCQRIDIHEHELLDFADIRIGEDNKLFIDPSRIHLLALSGDKWANKAEKEITSFFNALFDAAKAKNYILIQKLLKNTCGEINDTQLGMSRHKPAGNGASFDLIFPAIRQMIEKRLFDNNLVISISDIPIWTKGIGEDRLSDWVTNIIWPVLEEFTLEQYTKYGIDFDSQLFGSRLKWSGNRLWVIEKYRKFICGNSNIILIPKKFLHEKLLFSTDDYLYSQVLTYRQNEHLKEESSLCGKKKDKDGNEILTPPTKKDLKQYEVKGKNHVDYILYYTEENPGLIRKYHEKFEFRPGNDSRFITDEKLDSILYR